MHVLMYIIKLAIQDFNSKIKTQRHESKIWHVFGDFPKMAELRLYMRPQMHSTQKLYRHGLPIVQALVAQYVHQHLGIFCSRNWSAILRNCGPIHHYESMLRDDAMCKIDNSLYVHGGSK